MAHCLALPHFPEGSDMERSAGWFVNSVVLGRALMLNGRAEANTEYGAIAEAVLDRRALDFALYHGTDDAAHAAGVAMLLEADAN